MSRLPGGRKFYGGVIAFAVAGAVLGVGAEPGANAEAQGSCMAALPASSPAVALSGTSVAAIPTETAISPEVNPPGDIPDNQAFVPYTSRAGGYTVTMPEGWARQESGGNVSFVDKLHTFSVEVRCSSAAPSVESATSVEAATLAAQTAAFELADVTAINLPAGPAILMHYGMNSAPDDVTGKQVRLEVDRYELFKDGREVVISLAVPAGSDNVDVSNQVSRSFQWTA